MAERDGHSRAAAVKLPEAALQRLVRTSRSPMSSSSNEDIARRANPHSKRNSGRAYGKNGQGIEKKMMANAMPTTIAVLF